MPGVVTCLDELIQSGVSVTNYKLRGNISSRSASELLEYLEEMFSRYYMVSDATQQMQIFNNTLVFSAPYEYLIIEELTDFIHEIFQWHVVWSQSKRASISRK